MKPYRITNAQCSATDMCFEVDDDATEEQIAAAAWECVAECVSYGWEEEDND